MPVRGTEGRVGLTLGTHEEPQGEGNPQLPEAPSFILVQLALCVLHGSREQPSMNPGQPEGQALVLGEEGSEGSGNHADSRPSSKNLSSQEVPGSTLAYSYAHNTHFFTSILHCGKQMPRKLVGGCPRAPGRMGKLLALSKLSSSDLLPPPTPTLPSHTPPPPHPHPPPPAPTAACLSWKGSRGHPV